MCHYYKTSPWKSFYFLWMFLSLLKYTIILHVFVLWGFHVVGLLMIIHMQFISCFSILNSTFFCFIFVDYNETYHMQLFLLFDCWCLMHIVSIYIHPRRSLISKSLQMLLYFFYVCKGESHNPEENCVIHIFIGISLPLP